MLFHKLYPLWWEIQHTYEAFSIYIQGKKLTLQSVEKKGTFCFFNKKHCVLDDSPGSACDGQTDERVLVRQPFCSTHCSAGQENCVPAVRHQGRQRLDRLVSPQIGAGAGTGAKRPTERLSEAGREETALCNCLRLPSAGHNCTVHLQRADSVCFLVPKY